jgi:antirestriction protein ArdC
MPTTAGAGRRYSGINVLILWGSVVEHGFPVQSWVTFRQALGLGGHVRKGEHGTTVVYADRFTPEDEKHRAQETGEKAQSIPFLKRFTVFNVAQCEGLPEDLTIAAPPVEPGLIDPKVDALIKAIGIDFRIGGDRAFYAPPPRDYIQVPPPQAYFNPIDWHRSALHEIGTTSTVLLGKKLCRPHSRSRFSANAASNVQSCLVFFAISLLPVYRQKADGPAATHKSSALGHKRASKLSFEMLSRRDARYNFNIQPAIACPISSGESSWRK